VVESVEEIEADGLPVPADFAKDKSSRCATTDRGAHPAREMQRVGIRRSYFSPLTACRAVFVNGAALRCRMPLATTRSSRAATRAARGERCFLVAAGDCLGDFFIALPRWCQPDVVVAPHDRLPGALAEDLMLAIIMTVPEKGPDS